LEDKVLQSLQIGKGIVVEEAFPVRLILQVEVPVPRDLHKSDDLIVTQLHDGIVDPSLIEAQPVVVRLAVGPNSETIAVHTDT
jgi:hypothetical protein